MIESPETSRIGQIKDLVFVSRGMPDEKGVVKFVDILVMTPDELKQFLIVWTNILIELPKISQRDALCELEKVS